MCNEIAWTRAERSLSVVDCWRVWMSWQLSGKNSVRNAEQSSYSSPRFTPSCFWQSFGRNSSEYSSNKSSNNSSGNSSVNFSQNSSRDFSRSSSRIFSRSRQRTSSLISTEFYLMITLKYSREIHQGVPKETPLKISLYYSRFPL